MTERGDIPHYSSLVLESIQTLILSLAVWSKNGSTVRECWIRGDRGSWVRDCRGGEVYPVLGLAFAPPNSNSMSYMTCSTCDFGFPHTLLTSVQPLSIFFSRNFMSTFPFLPTHRPSLCARSKFLIYSGC